MNYDLAKVAIEENTRLGNFFPSGFVSLEGNDSENLDMTSFRLAAAV